MVMGVPESGLPAAEGYARASGIPMGRGLIKNRYIGRTFIAPNQRMRDLGVQMKLNPLVHNIEGRRLVVVDDSIVRGTTTLSMIRMLRRSGATEIHLRVSSPPYRWPCFYGMDTGEQEKLLAHQRTVEDIAEHLEVDSLAYLSLDRLLAATSAGMDDPGAGDLNGAGSGYCTACLTGDYPVPVDIGQSKHVLEATEPVGGVPEVEQLPLGAG